ncbi:hypothetical protein ACFKKJ_05905, partial [Streptococcus agalactiae]|uniref:hypothetical protein n=1 Tax=Streptococcus agalactiae TaxID=1311 RepID=UPI003629906C
NSTALKRNTGIFIFIVSFGTIRNSTALKRRLGRKIGIVSFGTIRNSTALKPRRKFSFELS